MEQCVGHLIGTIVHNLRTCSPNAPQRVIFTIQPVQEHIPTFVWCNGEYRAFAIWVGPRCIWSCDNCERHEIEHIVDHMVADRVIESVWLTAVYEQSPRIFDLTCLWRLTEIWPWCCRDMDSSVPSNRPVWVNIALQIAPADCAS